MNSPASNRPKVVLYVEDDADHRELMRSAAKACHVKFGLALAQGYYDAIDYLGGQGQYADRSRYPVAAFVLLDFALGSFRHRSCALDSKAKRPFGFAGSDVQRLH
jgi:hypothetical protein